MDDKRLHNELLSIETFAMGVKTNAELLIQKCYNLRKKLPGSSLSESKNKGLSQTEVAKVLAKRRKNMLKKAS